MLICFHLGQDAFPQLVINECVIDRVNSLKVRRVMVSKTLTWIYLQKSFKMCF